MIDPKTGKFKKVYFCNENFFEIIDNEEKAYFLGLLMVDGCNNRTGFAISLQEEDSYILENFKNAISYTGNIKSYFYRRNDSHKYFVLKIRSRKISNDLIKHSVVPKKSYAAEFPKNIPKNLHHHFIRGVFDGDGCASICNKNLYFSFVGSKDLLDEINKIISENCSINKAKTRKNTIENNNIINMCWSGSNNAKKFRDWLYKDATLFLNRKKEKLYSIDPIEYIKFCKICNNKCSSESGLCTFHYKKQWERNKGIKSRKFLKISQISTDGKIINTWNSVKEARNDGFHYEGIKRNLNSSNNYKGYKWKIEYYTKD